MGVLPADPPAALAPLLGSLAAAREGPAPAPVLPPRRQAARTHESAPMQQAKVVLVFRTRPPESVASLCALQVCLGLWGGGPHSRLFREVRERRSLCYYAGASGDAQKGLVLVQVGCDRGAVDAVVAEVQAQLALLGAGEFTDEELATAVAVITGPLLGIDDSLAGRMHFVAEQWLLGIDQDPDARRHSIGAVTREAVAAAAASLWLDHEYALLPGEEA
jgi:predicted Zn-dependent peptidase